MIAVTTKNLIALGVSGAPQPVVELVSGAKRHAVRLHVFAVAFALPVHMVDVELIRASFAAVRASAVAVMLKHFYFNNGISSFVRFILALTSMLDAALRTPSALLSNGHEVTGRSFLSTETANARGIEQGFLYGRMSHASSPLVTIGHAGGCFSSASALCCSYYTRMHGLAQQNAVF